MLLASKYCNAPQSNKYLYRELDFEGSSERLCFLFDKMSTQASGSRCHRSHAEAIPSSGIDRAMEKGIETNHEIAT